MAQGITENVISIHAPTNGATLSTSKSCRARLRFQSTLRRTERHDSKCLSRLCKAISIHAPTNGATLPVQHSSTAQQFQSTLRRTERLSKGSRITGATEFQSTLRRTERQFKLVKENSKIGFQSTLRRTERLDYPGWI